MEHIWNNNNNNKDRKKIGNTYIFPNFIHCQQYEKIKYLWKITGKVKILKPNKFNYIVCNLVECFVSDRFQNQTVVKPQKNNVSVVRTVQVQFIFITVAFVDVATPEWVKYNLEVKWAFVLPLLPPCNIKCTLQQSKTYNCLMLLQQCHSKTYLVMNPCEIQIKVNRI